MLIISISTAAALALAMTASYSSHAIYRVSKNGVVQYVIRRTCFAKIDFFGSLGSFGDEKCSGSNFSTTMDPPFCALSLKCPYFCYLLTDFHKIMVIL